MGFVVEQFLVVAKLQEEVALGWHLKKKLEGAKYDAYPEAGTSGAAASDAAYKAKLEKQRRKLMEGGSDSDSSVSVFDPFMSK